MKDFLINNLWIIIKLLIVILCIVSIFLTWKFGTHDYKKTLGVDLGKPYHHTKDNDKISEYLITQSNLWGSIFIICVIVMALIFAVETIIKFVSIF